MVQSGITIASLFPNKFDPVYRWCNQAKLLPHGLAWAGLAWAGAHLAKHNQTHATKQSSPGGSVVPSGGTGGASVGGILPTLNSQKNNNGALTSENKQSAGPTTFQTTAVNQSATALVQSQIQAMQQPNASSVNTNNEEKIVFPLSPVSLEISS